MADNILCSSLEYNKSQSGSSMSYSIEDDTVITADALYIKIQSSGMAVNSYTVSAECTCVFSGPNTDVEADDPAVVPTLKDGSGNTVSTLASGNYYGFSLCCEGFSAIMTEEPTSISVNVTIVAENVCMGAFDSSETIAVTYSSSVPVSIDPSTPGYEAEEDTVTYGGNSYSAVEVSNSNNPNGGVANSEGNVNVSFTLNSSKPFCFEIHHVNGENSKLRMIVTIDGVVTRDVTSNISGNVRHYIGATGKYFGITEFLNSNNKTGDWMVSATGSVSIAITNYDGHVPTNVTFKIIFKPDS